MDGDIGYSAFKGGLLQFLSVVMTRSYGVLAMINQPFCLQSMCNKVASPREYISSTNRLKILRVGASKKPCDSRQQGREYHISSTIVPLEMRTLVFSFYPIVAKKKNSKDSRQAIVSLGSFGSMFQCGKQSHIEQVDRKNICNLKQKSHQGFNLLGSSWDSRSLINLSCSKFPDLGL